jgi:hypothetical protein
MFPILLTLLFCVAKSIIYFHDSVAAIYLSTSLGPMHYTVQQCYFNLKFWTAVVELSILLC